MVEQLYNIFLEKKLISTDSRNIPKKCIFFALKGPNFNGNEFAEDAIVKGASCVIIDEEAFKKNDEQYILVESVLECLQKLAAHHRKQFHIPVIGITGTNGKTTTKELTKAILERKYHTLANEGNLNNHIGVPITLLKLKPEHEIAIIEMGANHKGEIADLCEIAQPNFALITNIGKAHLEGFENLEGIIETKKELYDYVNNQDGVTFVNKDNSLLTDLSKEHKDLYYYGLDGNANVQGTLIEANHFVQLKWKGKQSELLAQTQLMGQYNFENVLAAICLGDYFDVPCNEIKEALENFIPSNNRSQIIECGTNRILLDAYNANPVSMEYAINSFLKLEATNKVVILGDMLELGNASIQEHKHIVGILNNNNIDDIVLIGKEFGKVKEGFDCHHFEHLNDSLNWITEQDFHDTFFLIKGSRAIGLEAISDKLVQKYHQDNE